MGTEITLDVAGLSISYAKNSMGLDHGALFQDGDRITIPEHGPDRGEFADYLFGAAMMRPLSAEVLRLRLTGYNIERAAIEYDRAANEAVESREALNDKPLLPDRDTEVMSFDEFRSFVAGVSIADLDDTFVDDKDDEGRWRCELGRFTNEAFISRIPRDADLFYGSPNYWSERSYYGTLVGFLDPFTLLTLFAENPRNHDAPVLWCHGPLVDAGWADARAFVPGARRRQMVLIATEGSSDVHILKRAIKLLRPEVSDFFRFIDVRESHPFSGVGGLVKFAEGLAKINVQNRVLFVLDNDAEGVDGLARIEALGMPANMRALTLPTLPALSAIPTLGPEGAGIADINGRAAAIECYLDLAAGGAPDPVVRWSNWKRSIGTYQGTLEAKDVYARAFHAHASEPSYDTSKLMAIVDEIVEAAADVAAVLVSDR